MSSIFLQHRHLGLWRRAPDQYRYQIWTPGDPAAGINAAISLYIVALFEWLSIYQSV
jgi:hypothetical protein